MKRLTLVGFPEGIVRQDIAPTDLLMICQKNLDELVSPKNCGSMYSTAITISVKVADKQPNCRSITSYLSLQVVATILATCKPCAARAIVRKNIISIRDSIDAIVNPQNYLLIAYISKICPIESVRQDEQISKSKYFSSDEITCGSDVCSVCVWRSLYAYAFRLAFQSVGVSAYQEKSPLWRLRA